MNNAKITITDTKKVLEYGERCLRAKYTKVENDGDYAIEREGDTVYLLFQWSNGKGDWRNNFDFPATPYSDMEIPWKCHRGFLRVWKSVKPYVATVVKDMTVKKFVIVGYSHGAALAALAHEYVWFNRPDLRDDNLEGYGFGSPRCYWGWTIKEELKERWENFYPIRNCNDIVTYMPPAILGFRHVGQLIQIGKNEYFIRNHKLKCIDAHYWENYRYSLQNCEE